MKIETCPEGPGQGIKKTPQGQRTGPEEMGGYSMSFKREEIREILEKINVWIKKEVNQ